MSIAHEHQTQKNPICKPKNVEKESVAKAVEKKSIENVISKAIVKKKKRISKLQQEYDGLL